MLMNKALLFLMITIGGLIGGWLPTLFGADGFSMWSILGSGAGSVIGVFVAYKISNDYLS